MHVPTTTFLATLLFTLTSRTAAELHTNGVCYKSVGGQAVYDEAATVASCGNYFMRNTGGEQWDTCPDCVMVKTGAMNHCNSAGWHIGGDEWTYYCELNGAEPMTG
ncbi:unnamed protein product [Periconia digitata]|uniref:Uncharacterized protein n=1 Tax=Periconia digitata TaxID=1303443 RepID=A0A9W4UJ79_9PLEO|nr:unnamed protein product [Periconia digitata]